MRDYYSQPTITELDDMIYYPDCPYDYDCQNCKWDCNLEEELSC